MLQPTPTAQFGQWVQAGLSSSGTCMSLQHSVHEPQDFSETAGGTSANLFSLPGTDMRFRRLDSRTPFRPPQMVL
jgi:hypothetical protein